MSAVTLDDLAAVLPTMERRDVAVLAHSVLGLKTPAQRADVSLFDRLRAGLWEFMKAVGFVTDDQARRVLARVSPVLSTLARDYYSESGTVLPNARVVFAEQRWVAVTGLDDWYDMQFDETVTALPEPAVLLVTCDVTAMHLRQEAWLAKLGRGKDAGPEHHAGRPAGPAQPDGAGP
jgi:hypothetical protein